MTMKKQLLLCILLVLFINFSIAQTTVNLNPIQDNSIYSGFVGNSNGMGSLFAGTPGPGNPLANRALLQFDIANNVPPTATINNAVLTLDLEARGPASALETHSIHVVLTPWGEGPSFAGGMGGGIGAAAVPPDATWLFGMIGGIPWVAAGGDFVPGPSATIPVPAGPLGPYIWNTAQMAADVQGWLNTPATNFGWLLKIDIEGIVATASRWGSKDIGVPPNLAVTYTDTLGLEDDELSSLSVYPNPTEGILNISVNGDNNFTKVAVFNLLGQRVYHATFDHGNNESIDISDLNSGVYLMEITTDKGSTIRRIIKE